MAEIDTLRDQLIEELWLPIAKEGGTHFYSRRKNKQMKLFILIDGVNFNGISRLEEEGLICRGDAILWVSDMIKAYRAETESRGIVLNGVICDEQVQNENCQLNPLFPRDIVNLDFTSQDAQGNNSLIEKILEKTEHFICLQNKKRCKGFVLLHTVIINSETINRNAVKNSSDAIQASGWSGLAIDSFPEAVSDSNQKIDFIKHVIQAVCNKYKYRISKIDGKNKIIDGQNQMFSTAYILVR